MTQSIPRLSTELLYLLSTKAVRERCRMVCDRVEQGESQHFTLDRTRLPFAISYVRDEVRANYPDLEVPYHSRWRHFEVGGLDRRAILRRHFANDTRELLRAEVELAIVSVLLDAGAGSEWTFRDTRTSATYGRSEGLALASFALVETGSLSSDGKTPWAIHGNGLGRISVPTLGSVFQVRPDNSLVALEGRVRLLKNLGQLLTQRPDVFGPSPGRLGNFADYVLAGGASEIDGGSLLSHVLQVFGPIWPGRVTLQGVNLGDVWKYPNVRTSDSTTGLVPFHKLSQWLTYSLMEPIEAALVRVTDRDALTGLAEYRNGGLFIDSGVVCLRNDALRAVPLKVDSEAVIEWRALTVALLDLVADGVRSALGVSAEKMPLASVLQGGTWSAGRKIARELRPGGGPPLSIESDGTVF